MKYLEPSFTVPVGSREPARCAHGWADKKNRCVFCGVKVKLVFVPRVRWCVICHKRSMLNLNGSDYCGLHANRAVLNDATLSRKAQRIVENAGPKELKVDGETE